MMKNSFNQSSSSMDQEFLNFWPLLTHEQKELVLTIIKSFTRPDGGFTTDQYSEELKQALNRVKAGEYYTPEQVKELLKKKGESNSLLGQTGSACFLKVS